MIAGPTSTLLFSKNEPRVASSPPTTIPITWSIPQLKIGALSLPLARLIVGLEFRTTSLGRQTVPENCWLDTGAPISVIPFHVHGNRFLWKSAGIRGSWRGQPCDLGHIDVWLPTDQPPYLRGPISMLAKFARSDPPGHPVPVLLGLEFFLSHQAGVSLLTPPQPGAIVVP